MNRASSSQGVWRFVLAVCIGGLNWPRGGENSALVGIRELIRLEMEVGEEGAWALAMAKEVGSGVGGTMGGKMDHGPRTTD